MLVVLAVVIAGGVVALLASTRGLSLVGSLRVTLIPLSAATTIGIAAVVIVVIVTLRLTTTDRTLSVVRCLKDQGGRITGHCGPGVRYLLSRGSLYLRVIGSWHAAPPGPKRDPHSSRLDQIRLYVRQYGLYAPRKSLI